MKSPEWPTSSWYRYVFSNISFSKKSLEENSKRILKPGFPFAVAASSSLRYSSRKSTRCLRAAESLSVIKSDRAMWLLKAVSQNSGIPVEEGGSSLDSGVYVSSSLRDAASPAATSSGEAVDVPVMMAFRRSYSGFWSSRYCWDMDEI